MSPRTDEYEQDNTDHSATATSSDDDDDRLKDDLAALARACTFTADEDEIEEEEEDPLLSTGDATVPFTANEDSDPDDDLECLKRVQGLYKPTGNSVPSPEPVIAAAGDDNEDDEDDFETVSVIFKRFSAYDGDAVELCPDSQDPENDSKLNLIKPCGADDTCKNDMGLSQLPKKRSSFPPSAQTFIDAVKKNRALQKFLRSKLIEIEAKIGENKKIRDNVKLLKDFQVSCTRKTGSAFSLRTDPRVQLISSKKSSPSNKSKSHNKKASSAMCYGPDENSRVANYKMVLERFPLSLPKKKWSDKERENLLKGIKQQFQETLLQISVDRMSSGCLPGDANDMDNLIESIKGLEITPARIREFLPKVNWDRLASMYVTGRTGAECESRWLNWEDPLTNRGPWTCEEDKSLLIILQEKGIRNWFDIAVSLATNRLPFQCLAQFQRSLNPSIINSEWTGEEDAQLRDAVACFGQCDWQSVATYLERRTGTQCLNRWKKSICVVKKGNFTPEEDERLTIAVMMFGRKWKQIAKYIPGRIQSQCRDRYLNSLDPSLKWSKWTEEEDVRLKTAITKYGCCWSKVAADVPPRTDCQCRMRWMVLKEAKKKQRSQLSRNFVKVSPSDVGAENLRGKRKRKSSHQKERSKKHAKETGLYPEEVQDADPKKERPKRHAKKKVPVCPEEQDIVPTKEKPKRHSKKAEEVQFIASYSDKMETSDRDVPLFEQSNVLNNMRSKRRAKKARIHLKEVENIAFSDKVKTCSKSSESQGDNITLACWRNKLKKKLSKCTKNASQTSSFSRTKIVSKQVGNQIPSKEQDGLSLTCGTGGTKDLLIQTEVDSSEQVRKPEGENAARKPEDAHNMNGDGNDKPLQVYVRKKTEKWSQDTEGCRACSPSKLKKGSMLLHGNKPTIIFDGSEPSMSKVVVEETVLHGGVAGAELTNINVVEEETDLHGGVAHAEPTNVNVEENDDLPLSTLQNKIRR